MVRDRAEDADSEPQWETPATDEAGAVAPEVAGDDPGGAPFEDFDLLFDEKPRSGPPTWSHFLTPVAILIGAAAVVAAIFVTDDNPEVVPADAAALAPGPSAPGPAAPAGQAVTDGGVTEPAAPAAVAAAPATLSEAFVGYAASIDLDTDQFSECLGTPETADAVNAHLERGGALGVSGTPTFFINNKRIVGAQPTEVFVELIAAELNGSPTTIEGYSAAIQQLAATDPPRFEILAARPDLSGAAIEGSPDAIVMVQEYSDFQCPFCRRWYDATLPVLRQQIGEDVALAFLHFPLVRIHPNAGNAHLAAECANQQGKFWEMHDLLFARQAEWSPLRN